MSDKNQAVIDFLTQCPKISKNPLFFNFINAKDNNKQLITVSNDTAVDEKYIDGSVLKNYTFNIVDYKSITYNAVVQREGYPNENITDMLDAQGIADWIEEQAKARNFPDFGDDCIVQGVTLTTNEPDLRGVDTNANPPLAKYTLTIKIEYLDISGRMWN